MFSTFNKKRIASKTVALLLCCAVFYLPPWLYSEVKIQFSEFQQQLRQRFPAREAQQRVEQWQKQLFAAQALPETEQVVAVNRFFHQYFRYQEDSALYGKNDYWASPLEFFAHGMGDCEDWAIAQYISLRALGIAEEKLRLIYVRASFGVPSSDLSEAHMVLGYYPTPSAQPLILDSLLNQVLPAKERSDLKPVFSFNSAGLWAGQGADKANASPTARLSPWREVLERMSREGIRLY